MKKRAVIILAALAILGFFFFLPRPILKDENSSRIISVEYNPYWKENSNEMPVSLSGYDEKKLLECLSRYKKYFTLSRAGQIHVSDTLLDISFVSDGKPQSMVLGDIHNYIAESYGSVKYGVYNADALRAELLDILGLPEHAGT